MRAPYISLVVQQGINRSLVSVLDVRMFLNIVKRLLCHHLVMPIFNLNVRLIDIEAMVDGKNVS